MPTPEHHRLAHMAEHTWEHGDDVFRFTWVGDEDHPVRRVYALAFLPDGRMILVGDGVDPSRYWLPGGGIEGEEDPVEGLRRELLEEVGGRLGAHRRLGMQRVERDGVPTEYHAFFWAQIEIDEEFVPAHEIVQQRIVEPEQFLDTLFWGRSDPKAEMLLEMALEMQNRKP